MSSKQLLLTTVYISLIIQVITGVVSLYGVFIPLKPKDKILNDVILIETIVQFIEGAWYVYIAYAMYSIQNDTIASRRYIDWVITTPIMLLSTILFMEYQSERVIHKAVITTKEVILNNMTDLTLIFIYNFFMLAFGFFGEIHKLNKYLSIPMGFLFFFLAFYNIWENFAYKTVVTRRLFYFLFVVWGAYGIAAMMPVIPKNIIYNCLDIISKNFYGLYIFYKILQVKESYKTPKYKYTNTPMEYEIFYT